MKITGNIGNSHLETMKEMTDKPLLRPYQEAAVAAITYAVDGGVNRIYYVAPTGTGKTVTFVEIIRHFLKPGHPAVVLAHREELLTQARDSILRADPALVVGMERASSKAPRTGCDVIVASVQTIGRDDGKRLAWVGAEVGASCIIVDECHHACSNGYENAFELLTSKYPDTPIIGCTATPTRLDQLALHGRKGSPFAECVYTYPIRQAIDDGYLCKIRGHRVVSDADLSGIKTVAGDYAVGELAKAVDNDNRTAKAIKHWEEIAGDRQTIIFCVNVAHAINACETWREMGYRAGLVTGATESQKRREIIEDYKAGHIQVLCNAEVLTEGFDAPETSCILMLRPTKSWGLYAQCIGRGTRLKRGQHQDLIVIDVVDNCLSHKLDVTPEAKREHPDKEQASVSALLGLPSGIDLEGHTLVEAADIKQELDDRATIMERYRPQTFSDLKTMLTQVDMFAGITAAEAKEYSTEYHWIQRGKDWLLNCGVGKIALLRCNEQGKWWHRIVNHDEQNPKDLMQCTNTENLLEAMSQTEMICENLFDSMFVARLDARWRREKPSEKQKQLLQRRGVPLAVVNAMNKGEASAMISKIVGAR